MLREISKRKEDLLSCFLASTCALTIGLNLSWSPDEDGQKYSDAQQDNMKAIMYLVAIHWSQWSGTIIRFIGAYKLMVIGVFVSILACVIGSIFPCDVVYLYVVRALQGFGCASLAVAVPNYTVDNAGGLYQSAMLCLMEVFILCGILISHVLSLLVKCNQINILTACVTCLNILSLLLIRMTSQILKRSRCDIKIDPIDSTWEEPMMGVYKRMFTDKQTRNDIFVAVVLFVFRDFGGIHVFKNSIQRIYSELNTTPISYRQCALFLTTLQLIFAIVAVLMVEFYGKRNLMFISSFGMLLSMTVLELIIWNDSSFTSEADRNFYVLIVLIVYIIFFAHGIGSIPWAFYFEIINPNVRQFATGLIVSSHFLFLMITEFSYINEKNIYFIGSYWFILICGLQIIFVNIYILEKKDFDCTLKQ